MKLVNVTDSRRYNEKEKKLMKRRERTRKTTTPEKGTRNTTHNSPPNSKETDKRKSCNMSQTAILKD